MIPSNIQQIALKQLNEQYGTDLLDLQKCRDIVDSLRKEKESLENELNTANKEGFLGATLEEARNTVGQSKKCVEQSKELLSTIEKDLNQIDEVRKNLKAKFDKLNTYQTTFQYMRVVQQIDYLSSELKSEISKKDDEKCVTLFANLTEIFRIIADCPIENLKKHLTDIILFWHKILRDKLEKDFDEVLKQVKWPFLSTNFSLVSPFEVNVEKLQLLVDYLLQIEIPADCSISTEGPLGVLSAFKPPCLPIQLLVQPLKKRFIYHFYGNRKTNRSDRPEWYLTQILTWIRDHQDYVDTWIQPVISRFGLHHIDARVEFMRALVLLAAEKLNLELPSVQYDDFTFSHSIDEALGFDKELKEIYKYPASEPSVIVVLTQAPIMVKWLIMEKKYATEKLDAILSSIEAFDLLTSDVEDLKITTCADAFITLLQTISERYECLPQPGHRLQFLELQLELLDDFRVRLLQIVNAEEGIDYMESKIPMVANTLYYIENVLIDWGAMLHYLNLYYYKKQSAEFSDSEHNNLRDLEESAATSILESSDSLFQETLSLYKHFRKDILNGLAEAVLLEIKKKSWDYRREKWSAVKVAKEFKSLSLTPSACPMFEVLAKRLHQLQKKLQSKLFTIVWRNIATQLDTYLFEDLIMDNRFSEGGALQLKFDISRNLLPLFAQYTDKPETYFTQIMESCNLLNLAKGSALLLRETLLALEGATGVEDARGKTLHEIGVDNFSPKMAVKILNQRVDITVERLYVD